MGTSHRLTWLWSFAIYDNVIIRTHQTKPAPIRQQPMFQIWNQPQNYFRSAKQHRLFLQPPEAQADGVRNVTARILHPGIFGDQRA